MGSPFVYVTKKKPSKREICRREGNYPLRQVTNKHTELYGHKDGVIALTLMCGPDIKIKKRNIHVNVKAIQFEWRFHEIVHTCHRELAGNNAHSFEAQTGETTIGAVDYTAM